MIKHYFTSLALMFSLHLSGDQAGILRSLRDVDNIQYNTQGATHGPLTRQN